MEEREWSRAYFGRHVCASGICVEYAVNTKARSSRPFASAWENKQVRIGSQGMAGDVNLAYPQEIGQARSAVSLKEDEVHSGYLVISNTP